MALDYWDALQSELTIKAEWVKKYTVEFQAKRFLCWISLFACIGGGWLGWFALSQLSPAQAVVAMILIIPVVLVSILLGSINWMDKYPLGELALRIIIDTEAHNEALDYAITNAREHFGTILIQTPELIQLSLSYSNPILETKDFLEAILIEYNRIRQIRDWGEGSLAAKYSTLRTFEQKLAYLKQIT